MSRGLTKEKKTTLVESFRKHPTDTGSTEVQVAVLSTRIDELTEHLRTNKQDHHTRLGLLKMVHKRRRLINYLKRQDFDRYKELRDKVSEEIGARIR